MCCNFSLSHRKENINQYYWGGPYFFMVQPHPSSFPSSCFHSQSENVTKSSCMETHLTEGHRTGRVKWVTFSLLIHLMSNSDELCSSLRLTSKQQKMFSSRQDLGTQTVKKKTTHVFKYFPKHRYFVAFTHGWQISIRAGLHLLFGWSVASILIQLETARVS